MKVLNRREMMRRGAGVAFASFVACKWSPSATAMPLNLPAGIQLYAVRDALEEDARRTLQRLAEIGFREVELAGLGRYSAKDIGAFLKDAGLRAPSAHLLFVDDADLDRNFDICHAIGAEYVTSSNLRSLVFSRDIAVVDRRIPPKDLSPLSPVGLHGFQKTAAKMNDFGRRAQEAGLQYCYHNHNLEFERMPDGSTGFDVLLRETNPDSVTFELDCGWVKGAGEDPVRFLRDYKARFRMLHVKDFKMPAHFTTEQRGRNRPEGALLGHGFIDYRPVFSAARSAGIEHIFAEQEGPYQPSEIACARTSFSFLQRFS